ncbi:unnamed protein product [Allacma fusca]|uniref:Uncharacterized protein n=1 Tax=Allacma fusca TaxID=39272 RepID=A0A8J2L4K7_9HEXA|nr:unnamed protein product [Allacma fusca]
MVPTSMVRVLVIFLTPAVLTAVNINPLYKFLNIFHSSVLQQCSHLDILIGGEVYKLPFQANAPAKALETLPLLKNTIVQILPNVNSSKIKEYLLKHSFGCSIFIFKYQNDIESTLLGIPKKVHLSVHFIFVTIERKKAKSDSRDRLLNLFNWARILKHKFCLVISPFKTEAFIPEKLTSANAVKIYEWDHGSEITYNMLSQVLISKVDFLREPLVAQVCPHCTAKPGTTLPADVTVIMEFATYVNSSIKLQPTFAEINTAQWLDPLEDGRAMIAMPVTLFHADLKFLPTRFVAFHNFKFVSGLPRLANINSLKQLFQPLTIVVWVLIVAFVFALGAAMEFIYWYMALSSKPCNKFRPNSKTNCNNAKENFKEILVHLIESVILLQPIVDQGISTKAANAAKRYSCYELILQDGMVCLAPSFLFGFIGTTFMTDVNTQPLWVESNEGVYTEFVTAGMSRKYPHLLDSYNFVWSGLTSSGIYGVYSKLVRDVGLRKGQKYAQMQNSTESYMGLKKDMRQKQLAALSIRLLLHWRRKWKPEFSVAVGLKNGQESLAGLSLLGVDYILFSMASIPVCLIHGRHFLMIMEQMVTLILAYYKYVMIRNFFPGGDYHRRSATFYYGNCFTCGCPQKEYDLNHYLVDLHFFLSML